MITPKECMKLDLEGYTTTSIMPAEEPYPRTYFEFAVADLESEDTKRSCVNALSNAKRALHFQIDLIAQAFGIREVASPKKLSFPQKLQFCINCGVIGPRILRKLNRVRNAMEHEYYIPNKEETEDFVDVVELFLTATDRFIYQFPDYIELSVEDEDFGGVTLKSVKLELEPSSGVVEVILRQLESNQQDEVHTEAAIQRERIEQEIQEASKQGKKTIILDNNIEHAAYSIVLEPRMKRHSFSVSATEGELYFKWISILSTKSK
jgi:hypothetical protein